MNYKYMRDNLSDEYGFLQLQDKILEIAVYVDSVCKQNDIDYCLMGGSALGAKRHGGFIPWDDDLDIFMTPDAYEKFRSVFNREGDKKKYYLQEWGLTDGMVSISKVRMNGTTYIESLLKDWDIHHGIYIDIFILHNCPDHKIQQMWQCLWAKYVIMKGLAVRGYNEKKGFLGFALKVMRHLPDKMWVKYGLKQVYKYRNKDTGFFCNFMGRAIFKNAIYDKKFFTPTVYVPFEKVWLKVPKNLHEFLTYRFGDYMIPPDKATVKKMQHAESWDTEKDFRDVIHNTSDKFYDEFRLI